MQKIFFFPMISYSHICISVSIAKNIIKNYNDKYEIYFAVNKEYESKIRNLSNEIKFIIYEHPMENQYDTKIKHENEHFKVCVFQEFGKRWNSSRTEFVKHSIDEKAPFFYAMKKLYPIITKIIQDLEPNLIIYDQLFTTPIGIDQNIPYVMLMSSAPTYFGHYQLPPSQSNLSGEYNEENIKLWKDFISKTYLKPECKYLYDQINNWLKEFNCPNLDNKYYHYVESPYLNVYNYPKELDYQNEIVKMPGNWVSMNTGLIDPFPKPYELPESLKKLKGNLIYFSLGSLCTVYEPLMNHLLDIFEKLPYRFIVSTGLIGHKYKLKKNMVGEKFINQLAVLQVVDLMITHGGNNSITECFHFGVPMIVLPLFGDQIDNARRIEDKKFGINLNPFKSTLEDFQNAISFCLNENIQKKLKKISENYQQDNGLNNVCENILKLIKNHNS